MIRVKTFALGELFTNCYLVHDLEHGYGIIIDPGGDPASVISFCQENGITPELILATHGHFDHIGGVSSIKTRWDIPFGISSHDEIHYMNMKIQAELFGCFDVESLPEPEIDLSRRDSISSEHIELSIIPTPGHSKGSITFVLESNFFVGDLLFQGSIGRTDIPGGDMDELLDSVRSKIFPFSDGTVLPGHGETTDIATERETNPFFAVL